MRNEGSLAFIILSVILCSLEGIGQSLSEQANEPEERRRRIDLREANAEEIRRNTGLDRIQAIRVQKYRMEHGPIRSFYELHYLKGFSSSLVERLRQAAYLSKHEKRDSMELKEALQRTEGRFRVQWGRLLQKREGYRNGAYIGDPASFKGSIRIEVPNTATLGGSFEKDPGEAWGGKKKDPRRSGAYFKLHRNGILEKAIAGPLRSKSGGGLLIDNGIRSFGGIGPSDGKMFELSPHTGSADRTDLKGVAAALSKSGWRLGMLLSQKDHAAKIGTTAQGEVLETLYRNGIHRRASKVERMNEWQRRDLMAHASWKGKEHGMTATYHQARSSHPLASNGRIRDRFKDRNVSEAGAELHYRRHQGRHRWSLSFAMEKDRAFGWKAAFLSRPYEALSIRARTLGSVKGYDPFWSPIARNGRPFLQAQLAMDQNIAPGWRSTLSARILHRDWAYYGRTGSGTDRSFQAQLVNSSKENGRLEIEVEHQEREKDRRKEGLSDHPSIEEQTLSLTIQTDAPLTTRLRSQVRIASERSLHPQRSNGTLFAHDLVRKWKEQELKLYWRLAYFDAPEYRTRPYAYENDLLYSFSVRSYYRTGIRSYILLRIGLTEWSTLEGKVGVWAYRDPEKGRIGKGDRAIPGRYRSRFGLQLRGSF